MNEKEINRETAPESRVQELFVEYLVCPNCGKPLCAKSKLPEFRDRFCGKCGNFILKYVESAFQHYSHKM